MRQKTIKAIGPEHTITTTLTQIMNHEQFITVTEEVEQGGFTFKRIEGVIRKFSCWDLAYVELLVLRSAHKSAVLWL